jgi:hypothetical protein
VIKTMTLLVGIGALLVANPAVASAPAVPADVVGMAVDVGSSDPGASASTLASCWADSAHTAPSRLQFCLAYEVVASHGNLAGPSIRGVSPSARSATYLSRLGVPASSRKAELDRLRSMVSAKGITSGESAAETYTGELVGGSGTLSIGKGREGVMHVSIGVSGHGCAGHVEGNAREDGPTLRLVRASNGDECSLDITRGHRSATVVEHRCPIFHGASCDFGGTLQAAP